MTSTIPLLQVLEEKWRGRLLWLVITALASIARRPSLIDNFGISIGIARQFAACFRDYRNPDLIEHTAEELMALRVYGLALGYEDLNDHEELWKDTLLAVLVEKSDRQEKAR